MLRDVHKTAAKLLALSPRLVAYHGTEFGALNSILSKGILPNSSIPYGRKYVYLTPEFERAAGYATYRVNLRSDAPVILEVSISNPSRYTNIVDDPNDKRYQAWNDEDVVKNYDREFLEFVGGELQSLFDRILKKLGKLPVKYKFSNIVTNITDLDGVNLYKYMAKIVIEKFPDLEDRRKDILMYTQKEFSVNSKFCKFFEVRNDGTLKLDAKFYEEFLEQFRYKSDPSAIKAVWVLESDFPEAAEYAVDVNKAGAMNIPHRSADSYYNLLASLNRNIVYFDVILSGYDEDNNYNMKNILIEFEYRLDRIIDSDIKQYGIIDGDIVHSLLDMYKKTYNEKYLHELKDYILQIIKKLKTMRGKDVVHSVGKWLKIDKKDVDRLVVDV